MIQLNKINSTYHGKVHIEVGECFDMDNEYINKTLYNSSIVDINIFCRFIKESVKDKLDDYVVNRFYDR